MRGGLKVTERPDSVTSSPQPVRSTGPFLVGKPGLRHTGLFADDA